MYNCLVVRQERCDIYNVGVHRIVIFTIRPDLPDSEKNPTGLSGQIPDTLPNTVNVNIILILAIKLYDIIYFQV